MHTINGTTKLIKIAKIHKANLSWFALRIPVKVKDVCRNWRQSIAAAIYPLAKTIDVIKQVIIFLIIITSTCLKT
jgi:hypothetical protein